MNLDQIAFVDIETTGSRAEYDKVLEIAIICIKDNQIETEFSTLINPQIPFSPFIEMITGIKPRDVKNAPSFEEVQDKVFNLLNDRLFVAHNVGFDYGFIKYEFKRLGLSFNVDRCCTVKLSRHFFPEYRSHNLDSLIQRFNFKCENRHRAYSDTSVLWQFYQHLWKTFPADKIETAIKIISKRPGLPAHIDKTLVDNLPENPGVYIFYGEEGIPLYVGKSKNIKDRILSHFANINDSAKERDIAQQLRDIEVLETAGELGALLLEAQLVKKLQPVYNKKLRYYEELVCIMVDKNKDGYSVPTVIKITENNVFNINEVLAVHKTKSQAKKHLENTAEHHHLCKVLLGIEKSTSGCFNFKIGKCSGACCGKESQLLYNARFSAAFSRTAIQNWPYKEAIMIDEIDIEKRAGERHIFSNWQYLGVVKYTEDTAHFEAVSEALFDYDRYIILKNYLKNSPKIKPVSLKDLEILQSGCIV